MSSEGLALAVCLAAAAAAAMGLARARRERGALAADRAAAALLRLFPERTVPWGPEPPEAQVRLAPPPARPAPISAAGALAATVSPALERASEAAAYLRLGAASPGEAARELGRLEEALEELRRRTASLAAAEGSGAEGPVDLARLVGDLLAAAPLRRGVRIRRRLRPAWAVADERRLRAALREALVTFAGAEAPGGELTVSVEPRGAAAVIELTGGLAGRGDGAAALVRAVLGPRAARVEEEAAAGRGRTLRVTLARVAVEEPA